MDDHIVAISCLCDDVLKALDHYEDPQRQMSDAEVMTTALVAAVHFHGHWQRAHDSLGPGGYLPARRGNSRFPRRRHTMGEVVLTGFPGLGAVCTPLNPASVYGIDRGAIAAGDTSRRSRARLYPEAASRGDSARNWR